VPISQQVFRPLSRYTLVMSGQLCASSTACLCWLPCGFITAEPEPTGRFFSALSFFLPITHGATHVFHTNKSGKCLHQISTGKTQVVNPVSLHESASSWNLALALNCLTFFSSLASFAIHLYTKFLQKHDQNMLKITYNSIVNTFNDLLHPLPS